MIDGVVEVPNAGIREIEWHFQRAGAVFTPPGDACAEPAAEHWDYTGSNTQEVFGLDVTATVTWNRVSTVGCVDRFEPSGTAQVAVTSESCTSLSYDPDTGAIEAGDGELVIDRSTDPPTFAVTGASEWPSAVTCTHADGSSETSQVSAGGEWSYFRGRYDGAHFSGGAHFLSRTWGWTFARQ